MSTTFRVLIFNDLELIKKYKMSQSDIHSMWPCLTLMTISNSRSTSTSSLCMNSGIPKKN